MAETSPYVSEFATASRAVAQRLRHPRWALAYQSRSGDAPVNPPAPGSEGQQEQQQQQQRPQGQQHGVRVC